MRFLRVRCRSRRPAVVHRAGHHPVVIHRGAGDELQRNAFAVVAEALDLVWVDARLAARARRVDRVRRGRRLAERLQLPVLHLHADDLVLPRLEIGVLQHQQLSGLTAVAALAATDDRERRLRVGDFSSCCSCRTPAGLVLRLHLDGDRLSGVTADRGRGDAAYVVPVRCSLLFPAIAGDRTAIVTAGRPREHNAVRVLRRHRDVRGGRLAERVDRGSGLWTSGAQPVSIIGHCDDGERLLAVRKTLNLDTVTGLGKSGAASARRPLVVDLASAVPVSAAWSDRSPPRSRRRLQPA